MKGNPMGIAETISKLTEKLGESRLATDPQRTERFKVGDKIPAAVVFPGSTRQAAEVIAIAAQGRAGVTVWGAGTKMDTGLTPEKLDIVLCTRKMNHVIDVDAANLTITVEAGVRFSEIQARLAAEEDRCYLPVSEENAEFICSDREHSGCFLPLDPAYCEKSTIGGILAASNTGPRRLLYGLPRDLVLGLRFVTPGGEIVGAGGKTVKNVSGYDVTKLMIGSYGSLGVLCEATLRLLPFPEKMQTLLFAFDGLDQAAAFAGKIHNTQLLPAAVDILNRQSIVLTWPGDAPGIEQGSHLVAVALEGFAEPVDRMRSELQTAAGTAHAVGTELLKGRRHQDFWHKASHIGDALADQWEERVMAKMTYPISHAAEIAAATQDCLGRSGIPHTLWVHSGSGVAHVCAAAEDAGKTAACINGLLDQCGKIGGNLIISHAPETIKSELPVWGAPGSDTQIMARIKQQIDPARIMSPGRFIV